MKITIQIKNIYGNETIYPICDDAKTFAAMLRQKTLTNRDLAMIRTLGYAIEVQPQTLSIAA